MDPVAQRLFVGGLAWSTTEEDLARFFAQVGEVRAVTIVLDRETGRSKGFGFVELADPALASAAISRLDGHALDGRMVRVAEARPRDPRPAGGPRGGYRDERR